MFLSANDDFFKTASLTPNSARELKHAVTAPNEKI